MGRAEPEILALAMHHAQLCQDGVLARWTFLSPSKFVQVGGLHTQSCIAGLHSSSFIQKPPAAHPELPACTIEPTPSVSVEQHLACMQGILANARYCYKACCPAIRQSLILMVQVEGLWQSSCRSLRPDVVLTMQEVADHPELEAVIVRQHHGDIVKVPAGWLHSVENLAPCVKLLGSRW